MRGPKPKYPIELTTGEERELRRVANSYNAPHVKVIRAWILLAAHDHPEWSHQQIAQEVGCTDRIVRKWRRAGWRQGVSRTYFGRELPVVFPLNLFIVIILNSLQKHNGQKASFDPVSLARYDLAFPPGIKATHPHKQAWLDHARLTVRGWWRNKGYTPP